MDNKNQIVVQEAQGTFFQRMQLSIYIIFLRLTATEENGCTAYLETEVYPRFLRIMPVTPISESSGLVRMLYRLQKWGERNEKIILNNKISKFTLAGMYFTIIMFSLVNLWIIKDQLWQISMMQCFYLIGLSLIIASSILLGAVVVSRSIALLFEQREFAEKLQNTDTKLLE